MLHMNSLSHFNSIWRIPFMWFMKSIWIKFFIQTNINVKIYKTLLKKHYHLKGNNFLLRALCQIFILCVFQNTRWSERKSTFKNNTKCTQKKFIFLLAMHHHNMLSPFKIIMKSNAQNCLAHPPNIINPLTKMCRINFNYTILSHKHLKVCETNINCHDSNVGFSGKWTCI